MFEKNVPHHRKNIKMEGWRAMKPGSLGSTNLHMNETPPPSMAD